MNAVKLINFIKNNLDNDAEIQSKLLDFARSTDPMNMRNFFVRCDKIGLWGNEIAYDIIKALIQDNRGDVVCALCETANENAPHYGIYRIGQALADFKNFNLSDGRARLCDGLYHCAKNADHLAADMDNLAKNAFLLENVKPSEAEPYPKLLFEVVHSAPFHESPYTCAVMCDAAEFGKHAETFVKGLCDRCGGINIFMLVVNPDEDVISRCSASDGITVASMSYDGQWAREFCSAAKFAVAGDILRVINGPALFMNIDLTFQPGCEKILSEFAAHDISTFDTGDLLPSRRISSLAVASQPCDESFAFWNAAGDFVLKRLARRGPLSELGGAALFAATCWAKSAGVDVFDVSSTMEDGKALADALQSGDEPDEIDARPPVGTDDLYRLKSISDKKRVVYGSVEGLSKIVQPKKKDRKITTARDAFNDKAKLFDFLKKNSHFQKQEEAIINFAQGTDVLSLHRFLEQCQWEGFAAPLVAYRVVYNLVSNGNDDMASSLLVTANKSSPLYGIFNVGQAFVDCKNFEVESCGYHLREGVYHCLRNKTNLPDLGFLMQNAYLMESVAWPSPERCPLPEFEIVHEDRFEGSPYTLSMWGSPLYFKHYWEQRIKNIRETCGDINIFLLLINPDNDSISKVKSCRGVTLATANCPEAITERFTLVVLVALRKYLEICNQPIVGIELDSIYPTEIKGVLDFMAQCPIIIAETDDLYPALRIDGGACAHMPCDEAFAFLDMYIDHISEDLARGGPIYLFDQMARYRIVAECRKKRWNMIDINKHTDGEFRRLFKQTDYSLSLEERKKTRLGSEYTFTGMSENRRFIIKKAPQSHAE